MLGWSAFELRCHLSFLCLPRPPSQSRDAPKCLCLLLPLCPGLCAVTARWKVSGQGAPSQACSWTVCVARPGQDANMYGCHRQEEDSGLLYPRNGGKVVCRLVNTSQVPHTPIGQAWRWEERVRENQLPEKLSPLPFGIRELGISGLE